MRQRIAVAVAAAPPGRRLLVALGAAMLALLVALPTMVLAHTDQGHPTATTLECDESSLLHGGAVECTVTVVDEEADEAEVANPLGNVTISSDRDGELDSCALAPVAGSEDASSCSVALTLDESAGAHVLTATYGEQEADGHLWSESSGTALITVIGGTIVIEKTTPTGEGSFDFSGDLGDFTLTTDDEDDTVSAIFGDLAPGGYSITEEDAAGWQIQDIACVGAEQSGVTIGDGNGTQGANTVTIDLVAGEAVTCTFTNSNLGTVTILKSTGDDDGTFAFESNLPGGDFSLPTVDGEAEHVVNTAVAGTGYFVTLLEAEGWELSSITCSATDGSHGIDETTGTVTLSVSPGGSVTCTFASVLVEEEEEDELVERGCPAAPAIAASYLKELEVRAGGPFVPNIVAQVAQALTQRAAFEHPENGTVIEKCDDGYEDAVREFVDEQIEAREELNIEHPGRGNASGGNGNVGASGRGGPPPWAGGPNR